MFSSAAASTFGLSSRHKAQYNPPATPPLSTYYPNPHHPSHLRPSSHPLAPVGAFSPASSVASGYGYEQPGCTPAYLEPRTHPYIIGAEAYHTLPTPANSSPFPQPADGEADDEADSEEDDEEEDDSPMNSHQVSLASPEDHRRGVLPAPWSGLGVGMNGNMMPFSASQAEAGPSKSKNQPDMFMAPEGHETGMATISTPLAAFVASTLIWIWFGDHTTAHPPPIYPTPPHDGSSPDLAQDPFQSSQIDQHQILPAPQFSSMVSDILHRTSISHSVTLLGLLYVYRLKKHNHFVSSPGSEIKPFITGLMLANKYLDDNTYTNKTWAELAGMTVKEVNSMEKEFLQGLQYRLQVTRQDYLRWKSMLDGYITSRQRQQSSRLFNPVSSFSQSTLSQPLQPYGFSGPLVPPAGVPSLPVNYAPAPLIDYTWPAGQRARSASPPWADALSSSSQGPGAGGRKRPREDAFALQHGHNMSVPAISIPQLVPPASSSLGIPTPAPHPDLSTRPQTSGQSSLSRSSSLTRQVARIPRDSPASLARRGSAGHLLPMDQPMDLRHLAAQQSQAVHSQAQGLGLPTDEMASRRGSVVSWYPDSEYDAYFTPDWASYQPQVADYQSLGAPYDLVAAEARHRPTTLDFVSLAADPHPGYDGSRRKGVLRYQEAQQQVFDSASGHVYTLGPDGQSYALTGYMPPGMAGQAVQMGQQLQPRPTGQPRHSIAALTGNNGAYEAMDVDAFGPASAALPPAGPAQPIPLHPHPHALSQYVEPQPARFANAGPPGYAYRQNPHPAQQHHPHASASAIAFPHGPLTSIPGSTAGPAGSNRWSWGSDDPGFYYSQAGSQDSAGPGGLVGRDEQSMTSQMAQYGLGIGRMGPASALGQMEQRARSQYSSPMPRWDRQMGQG